MKLGLLFLALLGACGSKPCRDHTALVTLRFDSSSAQADGLTLTVSVGGKPQTLTTARTDADDTTTVQIDFDSGYPAGSTLDVTVLAQEGGADVGTGHGAVLLGKSCGALTIEVTGSSGDLGTSDASPDALGPDLGRCPVLYVSNMGDDLHDGCTVDKPLATVAHAESIGGGAQEVRVCAGTYKEPSLVVRGVLKGGYACTSWMRAVDYGYPRFDTTNQTTILPDASTPGVTVKLMGTASAPASLDGFTVQGAVTGTGLGTAVVARGPATISNNRILGGGTTSSTDNGSIGLAADGDEDITNNFIDGGSGVATGSATGSIGVLCDGMPTVSSAVPHLHDNTISGGTGHSPTNGFGSIGLLLAGSGSYTASTGKAVEGNVVSGGSGNNQGTGSGPGTTGVLVSTPGNADFVGNQIDGGTSANATAIGLLALSKGALHLYANRVYGGSGHGTLGIQISTIDQVGSAILESNMILGGKTVDGPSSEALTISLQGTRVVHNTIVASDDSASSDHLVIHLGGETAITGVVIDDNFLAGNASLEADAVYVDNAQCAKDTIAALIGNVSMFTTHILHTTTTGSCSAFDATYTSDQALESAFASSDVHGNLNIAQSCSGSDSGCLPAAQCDTAQDCLTRMFVNWDVASNGLETLMSGGALAGWHLAPYAPCAVTKDASSVAPVYGQDLYGTVWPAIASAGAAERSAICGQ